MDPSRSITCGHCGALIADDAGYCHSCGKAATSLASQASSPKPAATSGFTPPRAPLTGVDVDLAIRRAIRESQKHIPPPPSTPPLRAPSLTETAEPAVNLRTALTVALFLVCSTVVVLFATAGLFSPDAQKGDRTPAPGEADAPVASSSATPSAKATPASVAPSPTPTPATSNIAAGERTPHARENHSNGTRTGDLPIALTPELLSLARSLYSVGSLGAVDNTPANLNCFSISEPVVVTYIMTYHWNHGRGKIPGRITLVHKDGTVYGPWQTRGRAGPGGVPNAIWETEPAVLLKPGVYTLKDSHHGSWSQNDDTVGRGICEVRGVPTGILPVRSP